LIPVGTRVVEYDFETAPTQPTGEAMIRHKWLRYTLGVLLGGFAGLSLTSTVLPTAMSIAGMGESFMIRWDIAGYAAHSVLAWAAGGWATVRVGKPWAGSLIFGLVGVISGALICAAAFGAEGTWLLFSGVAAGAYGTIGGLLLGIVLQPPAAPTETEDQK
jgi:hypothetical protein